MSGADTVTVLLFSVLRDALGTGSLTAVVPSPPTAGGLLDALAAEHAVIANHKGLIRMAINEHYAARSAPLRAGDTVALLTPVSGG